MKTKTATVTEYTPFGTNWRFLMVEYKGKTIAENCHNEKSKVFENLKSQGFTNVKFKQRNEYKGIIITSNVKL